MKARLAVLALAGATVVHPTWLELLGIDPDHGNGTVESLVVLACVLAAIAAAASLVRARR